MKRRGQGVGEDFLVGADRAAQPPEEWLGVEHDIEQSEPRQPAQIAILM